MSEITVDKQIGIRLKIARQSCGYQTAAEFYQATGIPKTTYAQHESGRSSLTPELIFKYADLLEVNASWLLTGMGHPCPQSKNKEKKRTFIEQETGKYRAQNDLPAINCPPLSIHDTAAILNMSLFSKVIIKAIEVINDKAVSINTNELVKFLTEVYNNIEVLNVSLEDKEKFINFAVESVLKHNKVTISKPESTNVET